MASLTITDQVYGKQTVDADVLAELIASKPVQRLKGISQSGFPQELYPFTVFTRYEHSVGVMLLLKRLGAPEEEQIAGLLHDVSHTAFSHVIDWVVNEKDTSENFQDSQLENYILKTEIPAILTKHGYDVHSIFETERFPLLERDLPDLCGDRVDYALREFPADVAAECLPALTTFDRRIVMTDQNAAREFADYFLDRQEKHWAGFEAASRYSILAQLLKSAMNRGLIVFEDFWNDDAFVLNKLMASGDEEVKRVLTVLRKKNLEALPRQSTPRKKKFRFVDPHVLMNGALIRLSELDPTFRDELAAARERNDQGVYVAQVI